MRQLSGYWGPTAGLGPTKGLGPTHKTENGAYMQDP